MSSRRAEVGWRAPWVEGVVQERLPSPLVRMPLLEASSDEALLTVPSVGRFLARANHAVQVDRLPGTTDDDLRCFVEGPAVTASWLLEGRFTLRAAAVAVAGAAVLFTGPPSCGASTMAAAMARRGHQVLADRLVVVDGEASTVAPLDAAPQLWPRSGAVPLGGVRVRPGLPKCRMILGPPPAPAPLTAIVILDEAAVAAPDVRPLPAAVALPRVGATMWHRPLVGPLGLTAASFSWLVGVLDAARPMEARGGRLPGGPDQLAVAIEDLLE